MISNNIRDKVNVNPAPSNQSAKQGILSEIAQTGEAQSSATSKKYTVLMVDDEKHVLKALKRVFIEEDYKIITAENASDVLSAMAVNNVNLIISDYQMPGMSGIELLKIVKERHPNTIRIMLTGAADTSIEMGR